MAVGIIENKLLSKVLDEKTLYPFYKNNITENDFILQKDTFKFISSYVDSYGEVPPFDTVVAECLDFEYFPEVPDSFDYLVKELKNEVAKRAAYNVLQTEASDKFRSLKGVDFVNWLDKEIQQIKETVSADVGSGTNYAVNGEERKKYYLERKDNGDKTYIPTPFPTLTKWLGGGAELGDYILLNAYTNRGKSWIASQFGIKAWREGFGVLHYSPELSKGQQVDRLDTLNGHFNNMELKAGELRNEEQYLEYLKQFNGENKVPYIVKTMGDLPKGLSLDVIEADLQANKNVQMIIVDGFNLLVHKGGSGSSNRDKMTNTSRRLRQIFGKHKVVGLVVHHTPTSAEKENQEKDEATGTRIVKPPELYQYSETVAVIQDACTVLTFDSYQGVGKLKLAKARTPYVGEELELHCDFNLGWIKEVEAVDYF